MFLKMWNTFPLRRKLPRPLWNFGLGLFMLQVLLRFSNLGAELITCGGGGGREGGWVLLTWCIRPLSQSHPLWVLAQCASRSWKSPSSGLPSSIRTKGKACLDAPAVSTQSSTSRKSRSALSSLACKPPWRTFACVHDGKLQTWLFRSRRNIIFASPTKSVSDLSNVWFFNPLTATGDFLKSLTRPFSDESRSDFVWSYDAGLCKLFVHTRKV